MFDFTDTQRKTIASGLTVLALAVVVSFATFLGWLGIKVLGYLSPALTPVVFGLFLSMFFKPYYLLWRRLVRNPALAMTLMLLSVLVPMGFLFWNFGSFITTQVIDFLANAPARAARFIAWFNDTFPNAQANADKLGIPYMTWFDNAKGEVVSTISGFCGTMSGLLNWLVSIVFFAYFLSRPSMHGRDCVKQMAFLKEDTKVFIAEQIDAFLSIVVSFFQRQVLICLVEGLMYGFGFMLVGLPYGFLLGFLLGVLNLVPLLGSFAVLPMALPLAYWGDGGSALRLCGVGAVWLTGQFLDGYVITPRIQGNKTGLGYAGVIFSFFFWGVVFQSLLGLLLAIPLSAFCVVFWRALKSRYIKPVI